MEELLYEEEGLDPVLDFDGDDPDEEEEAGWETVDIAEGLLDPALFIPLSNGPRQNGCDGAS